MEAGTLKVGELAQRTGLTVRTLHHYDQIGLLKPSLHTEAGHRLYTTGDVARLQRILSLRQLGFSLDEIRASLGRHGFSPVEVIRLHLTRLREQITLQQELCQRLEGLERILGTTGEEVSPERFLHTIEAMTMIENYYTHEQLEQLKQRREQLGEEAIHAVEKEWPELIARMQAEMEAGTDPADPKVQSLAKRWRELVESFTGGDPGIRASVDRLWKEQGPKLAEMHSLPFDPRLMEYVGKAHAVAGKS